MSSNPRTTLSAGHWKWPGDGPSGEAADNVASPGNGISVWNGDVNDYERSVREGEQTAFDATEQECGLSAQVLEFEPGRATFSTLVSGYNLRSALEGLESKKGHFS